MILTRTILNEMLEILIFNSCNEGLNSTSKKEGTLSDRGVKGLILLGIGFDVISTFLKWGDPNLYLPWSILAVLLKSCMVLAA